MAVTIKQTEAVPAAYPDAPAGLGAKAAAINADMIWQRIEAYTNHRFTTRQVQWVAEGPGDWEPPLTPASVNLVEIWNGEGWAVVSEPDSPLGGYCLSGVGPYRFTANVGAGDVPISVSEAFRRLASYLGDLSDGLMPAGASSYSVGLDEISETIKGDAAANGNAMINSGAADLLRNYRGAA